VRLSNGREPRLCFWRRPRKRFNEFETEAVGWNVFITPSLASCSSARDAGMDEILNHGYVSPSRARSAAVSTRALPRAHAPFALDEPVSPRTGGWEWDTQNNQQANEDFDNRFDDFPDLPRRRTFHDHPASRSELGGVLCPPHDQIGGHEIVGHHITRQGANRDVPAAGVPNYAPNPTGPAAYEPGVRQTQQALNTTGATTSSNHQLYRGTWRTTAQAPGDGQAPKRRTGKRMGTGVVDSSISNGYQGYGFGLNHAAPLAPRSDILHRNVDIRGGCAVEKLPFVPGYGGYLPETASNFREAAKSNLAKRQPKELLVENHNPRMSGCTKASPRPF
jgi:hypothetical protein